MKQPQRSNSSPRRTVVVGSSGRLGSSLAEFLRRDHPVTCIGRKQMDLGSPRSIDEALAPLDYDHVIITGALTGVDYCESHVAEAFAVNAAGPARIADISLNKGAHVTYVSTDMVFDGMKSSPYVELDPPNPISVYGASKWEGEQGVLAASANNLVLRVSWVFGPGRPAFPNWIIEKACLEQNISLPADKLGCPTYTLDLIRWMDALIFGDLAGSASGIYHLCNSKPCSWREWGQSCIDIARSSGLPIITHEIKGVPLASVAAFLARRPLNSAMSTAKFSTRTQISPRDWVEAIREFVIQDNASKMYSSGARTP